MKMKKLFSALFLISLFCCFAVISAFSAEYSADAVLTGNCGEGSEVYWEIVQNEDGTESSPKYSMNIFGTGAVFKNLDASGNNINYNTYNNALWAAYIPTLTRVYVGDNIKTLDASAFMRNNAIHTIELGKNVTVLGNAAMEGCTALTTIYRKGNAPVEDTFDLTGITSLGTYLFDGCRSVKSIILPREGHYKLGTEFLKNNSALEELYIPKACYGIYNKAFSSCSALKNVYFEGDTFIEDGEGINAFIYCSSAITFSAFPGSAPHEYALNNASYTIDDKNYSIIYKAPYKLTALVNGEEGFVTEFVGGFVDFELQRDKETYILFADEACTKLLSNGDVTSDRTVYAKKLFNFVGYMVRVADYNGLRAIYECDLSVFASSNDYSASRIGILGAKLYGIDPELTLGFASANDTPIWSEGEFVGKLLKQPQKSLITFANTAIGYELEDGSVSAARAANETMSRAYVVLKNEETGEERVIYSLQTVRDLASACEATKSIGAATLTNSEISFLDRVVSLGISTDYIYTKEEALAHLSTMYNDPDHILSGQHISFGANTVKDSLNKLYSTTGALPAVLSYDVSTAYSSYASDPNAESTLTTIADQFKEYARQGGLITMSAHMKNPDATQTPEGGAYRGKLTLEQWDQLLDADWSQTYIEGNDIYNNFMTELSAIADFLQMLEDRGVTVFWRPYHETNGAWFWFCGASIPEYEFKIGNWVIYTKDVSAEYFTKFWTLTYNYLEGTRGLENLLWVYSPNTAKDGSTSSAYDVIKYYPGDDYVDVTGIDIYHGTDTLEGATPALMDSNHAENWSRLAGKYTGTKYDTIKKQMPVVYAEFGPSEDLRNLDPLLSYNGEDALDFVTKVNDSGRHMGWIVFWTGWTGNPISLDMMYNSDVFMQSEIIYDLAESNALLVNTRCGNN